MSIEHSGTSDINRVKRGDNNSFLDYLGYNSDELVKSGIPADESIVTIRCAEIAVEENRGIIQKIDVPNSDSLFTRFRNVSDDLCDRKCERSFNIDSTPDELDIMAEDESTRTYIEAKHANNKTNYNLREILGQLSECPSENRLSKGDMIAVGIPITQVESLADAWTENNNEIGIVTKGIINILNKNRIKFVVIGVTHDRYIKIDAEYLLDMYNKWS